jgi:hypothetical protein
MLRPLVSNKQTCGSSVTRIGYCETTGGHSDVAAFLLDVGADVHAVDSSLRTVLHAAAQAGGVFLRIATDLV